MKLRFLVIVFFIAISSNLGYSQQSPMFTQYMFNEIAINPAFTGTHQVISTTLLFRKQWLGVDGAPTTELFSMHSPVYKKNISWGGCVINDKIGVSNNLEVFGTSSYRLDVSRRSSLRFGLQLGFNYITHNLTELENIEEDDPAFHSNIKSSILPNGGAGIFYENIDTYFGISVPKILQKGERHKRHMYITGGKVFEINRKYSAKVSTMIRAVELSSVTIDASFDLIYRTKFSTGITLRSAESIDLLFLYRASNELRFGYSYDIILNKLSNQNFGSHEIVVNYRVFSGNRHGKTLGTKFF